MLLVLLDTFIVIVLLISLYGLYFLYYKKDQGSNIKLIYKKKSQSPIEDSCKNHELSLSENLIEKFEFDPNFIDRKKYQSKLCKFKDDTGYICPLHYKDEDEKQRIIPYQECTKDIQIKVCDYMMKEWSKEANINNIDDTNHYIVKNWSAGDILYVLLNENNLLGFIAIDRKQFYPFISHLYIIPENRKKGYGKLLLDFALEYISYLKFTEARLWCVKRLIPYYKKNGWEIIDEKDSKAIVMIKYI